MAALTLGAGAGAGAASAATVTAVYTGTALSVTDATGVFALDPLDPSYDPALLAGEAFALTFVFDTDLGNRTTTPGVGDSVTGGTAVGAPTPILSASFDFNGQTFSVGGTFSGTASIVDLAFASGYSVAAGDFVAGSDPNDWTQGSFFTSVGAPNGTLPTSLETPFTYAPATATGIVSFIVQDCDATGGTCTRPVDSFVLLDIDEVAVTVEGVNPSPVPLPASGALLLAALGAAGLARRRRT